MDSTMPPSVKQEFFQIATIQYLYKDQFGKHVFQFDYPNQLLDVIKNKSEKYNSINAIYQKPNKNEYIIRFNDTKHLYKSRLLYNLIFFIHRTVNERNKKTYINLHISDMFQIGKKTLNHISLDEL